MSAGGIARIDFALRVGEVLQQVEVQANQINVDTETSELSQTFSHKQLDLLPNIDRNPLYQMNLMPGANNGRGSGNYGVNGGENGSSISNSRNQLASIGGVDANANSVLVEGTFNREPQNAYVGVVPAIEGIQEVQIYTGKYNAEFGFSGSAVVNVITKSGTNERHGSAFEYLRNDVPDAKPFFAQSKTPFHRNQFGGAMGGPSARTSYSSLRTTRARTSIPRARGLPACPPTKCIVATSLSFMISRARMPAGNSSGQVYDPFTRQFDSRGNVTFATPFAGNIIPMSRWDPVAAKMNNDYLWGRANLPGTDNNLYYTTTQRRTVHQADGRLDYNLSEKDRFFFRYSRLERRCWTTRRASTSSTRAGRPTRTATTRTCISPTCTCSARPG